MRELESFILEFGKGFAFVERQKRMIVDGEDFYLDLLFFHRTLKRLVVVELKLGKFQARDKGQMELYLKWLDRYERQEGENAPVGLILCAACPLSPKPSLNAGWPPCWLPPTPSATARLLGMLSTTTAPRTAVQS